MPLISSISAEELALIIAPHGYAVDVIEPVAKTSRIDFSFKSLTSSAWLYGLDENKRSTAITFESAIACPIQFWHIEQWSRQTLFGRLRRSVEGTAQVDWVVPLGGVPDEYILHCFDIWRGIWVDFVRFCMKVDDERYGMK